MNKFANLKAYFTNKEILKRLGITLILLIIFRLLSKIPAPGIEREALKNLFNPSGNESGFFNIANILAGGTLAQFSIISVGLIAFINASVIFQLLGTIVPKIAQVQKMGEVGQKMINQWTRLLTVPLAALQSFFIYVFMSSQGVLDPNYPFTPLRVASLVFVLTAGAMLLLWIAELISERGFGGQRGGGVSVLVTAGIIASMPASIVEVFTGLTTSNFLQKIWIAFGIEMLIFGAGLLLLFGYIFLAKKLTQIPNLIVRKISFFLYLTLVLVIPLFIYFINNYDNSFTQSINDFLAVYKSQLREDVEYRFGFYLGVTLQMIVVITIFNESIRQIPIKFISRIRTLHSAQNEEVSTLPIKLLAAGVMPIIFASSILLVPEVINQLFGERIRQSNEFWGNFLSYASSGWLNIQTSWYYHILHFILVVLFSLFFITVIMKAEDLAESLKNRKSFIPGVRPGNETISFFSATTLKVTFWGGLVIALVSSLPFLLGIYNTNQSSGIENFIAGGTSVLIVVPTILTIKLQLDAIVKAKNYEKFEDL